MWRVLSVGALMAVVAGALPAQDPPERRLLFSPVRYELDLSVDYDEKRLAGDVLIRLRNRGDRPATEVPLQLYRLLTVEHVMNHGGVPVDFTQYVVSFEDFPQLQVTQVLVHLPTALPPGETVELNVRYGGYLLGYAETGMRYVQDRIDTAFTILRNDSWAFPLVGYPSLRVTQGAPLAAFDYVARVTVPESLVVASGGELVRRQAHDGLMTWTYRSRRPSWRMDFAVARYGTLERGPVRIFYLPDDSTGAAGVARAAADALELYESWFGPLHAASALTILEIPDGWGSQADVGTIIQTAAAFRDSTRFHEVYHEVSHLWNPPDRDMPSPRWNEGLAEFLEVLTVERLDGRDARDARAAELIAMLADGLPRNPRWREIPWTEYGSALMTGLSYRMGALFFDLLYRLIGPERFNAIVSEYYRERAIVGGTTEEFLGVIRRVGRDVTNPLLRDWFETTGWTTRIRLGGSIEELLAYYRVQ